MSRSKRKNPIVTEWQSAKRARTVANKKFRRKYHYNTNDDDVVNGGTYKKFYERWLIHDWAFKYTVDDLIKEWQDEEIEELYTGEKGSLHRGYGTLKNLIRWWKTHYLYK